MGRISDALVVCFLFPSRGEQELDEAVKLFKTPTHVWRYVDPEGLKGKSERVRIPTLETTVRTNLIFETAVDALFFNRPAVMSFFWLILFGLS